MKNLFKLVFLVLLLAGQLLPGANANAQTTVWIVRHAEKEVNVADPGLTPAGQQRAQALLTKLEKANIAAVWTTDFNRTRQTAEPVARHFKLSPQVYMDFHPVAATILQDYKNKNVLIVGHSNTIIPTIVALGAAKPFDTPAEGDFDMLFKVTIDDSGHAAVAVSYYGSSNHVTQIPE